MGAVKFTFDTSFDADDTGGGAGDSRRRKSYTADEIEAIRTAAYEDGRRSGEVRAAEMMAAAVAQFAEAVRDALSVIDKDVEAIRADAAQLALAAATKLASGALAHAPDAEIADTLRVALHEAISETHVTVKAAPGLIHDLQEKLTEVAVQEGYEGRLRFVPDSTLYGADCRIEWRGGGIERAHGRIEEHLADLVARRFPPLNKE
jgi:flagellar assembly protein FliH